MKSLKTNDKLEVLPTGNLSSVKKATNKREMNSKGHDASLKLPP
jgi:hypothetical protein